MTARSRRSTSTVALALAITLSLALAPAGCEDPEALRHRGGGNGGDGRNYIPGRIHPPSKLDGTKDLRLLQRDGERPHGRLQDSERARTSSSIGLGRPD